ncbi:MAG: hypothetical protein HW387_511 [Parachlamydiales bacterium]|nr:hypothetical protein [Parachlamydiales bacterium]
MYKAAYSQDGNIVFYLDTVGNKYAATGGSLAWRLNNPGLVHSTSRFFSRQGSIGHFGRYAIFATPENGREALSNWLHSKKYFSGSLKTIAKHYQPNNPDDFANRLSHLTGTSIQTKVKALSKQEFSQLLLGIEKLCGYVLKGDEKFYLLPKIIGKIENGNLENTYLIGGNVVLSKKEALEWTGSNRLDAVIVHQYSGGVHLRSRPDHCIQNVHLPTARFFEENAAPLLRVVGTQKKGQCIWAFINGIFNTKEDALEAATQISSMAGGERVLSMQNDTRWLLDLGDCVILKTSFDVPVINRTVKFLQYLLTLEEEEQSPIILFAHSQGGIILEHALELLKPNITGRFRIFTFGGGSFIAAGKSHSDSHNYASAADFVCLMGSPNLQTLALKRYHALKEGLTDAQMIHDWSFLDAILELDSIDAKVRQKFIEGRIKYYQDLVSRIINLTILDPDLDSRWKHKFVSDCYQATVQKIINKYRK